MRILIVSNNKNDLEITSGILRSGNFDTGCAHNGQEALKKLHAGTWDLIISDIIMPVMDGFRL